MSIILGLSGGYFHDSASAIVVDGKLEAFVEEERYSRVKHNANSRSCTKSTAACLGMLGLKLSDVDAVAISWNPLWPNEERYISDDILLKEILDPEFFAGIKIPALIPIEHNIAHAASAFYPSGFEEAGIIVMDGSGDGFSTSLFQGNIMDGITVLERYDYTQSLGWLYEYVTEHVGLGDWKSTGKLMGLAAFGTIGSDLDFLSISDEGYSIDLKRLGVFPSNDPIGDYRDLNFYWKLKDAYRAYFEFRGISCRFQSNTEKSTVTADEFPQRHRDLAATAQSAIELSLIALAKVVVAKSGHSKLCLAGGVALNCKANGNLWGKMPLEDLYVQPASSDSGGAIGSAFELTRRMGGRIPTQRLDTVYLGPSYTLEEIEAVLKAAGLRFDRPYSLPASTAHLLAQGKIVGWFQGRMEGGPRALGNRSILADPRSVVVRDRLNSEIKHRELWRPFGPSILKEHFKDYVLKPGPAQFMVVAYPASDKAKNEIPAAVHIDGTIRPQMVSKHDNPRYFELISEFYKLTSVPAILNTSFNGNDEPIVCTPIDAVRSFCSMPLDALCIGDFIVCK